MLLATVAAVVPARKPPVVLEVQPLEPFEPVGEVHEKTLGTERVGYGTPTWSEAPGSGLVTVNWLVSGVWAMVIPVAAPQSSNALYILLATSDVAVAAEVPAAKKATPGLVEHEFEPAAPAVGPVQKKFPAVPPSVRVE